MLPHGLRALPIGLLLCLPALPAGAQQLRAPQAEGHRLAPPTGSTVEMLPMAPEGEAEPDESMQLDSSGDRVQLDAEDAELPALLRMIADYHQLNLVLGPGVEGRTTVSIKSATLEEVLDAVLSVGGYSWHRRDNLLFVTRLDEAMKVDAKIQGRRLQVFPLNFVAATDVERVVTGLLSPVGKAFISESDPSDQRRTEEILIVEDIEAGLMRVESYLAQVDHPPRQVLIEAHVLQVSLDEQMRHGVNLEAIARAARSRVSFKTTGFADDSPTQGMTLGIDGSDLNSVLEMIRQSGRARTLASPKVLVVNRQEAKIQIGSQLGYFVTTTTQTSSLQSVEFLDLGIVLTVEPTISDDGRILMTVQPKVSGGRINPDTGLPEEDTTEVSTTVLLPDGGGVVIGGLIKENEEESHAMVPHLSRLPWVGKLFRRHLKNDARDEIIIGLVTRIVDDTHDVRPVEHEQLHQVLPPYAATPELQHPPTEFLPPMP